LGFNFLNRRSQGTLDPGEVSAWLVIQTDRHAWEGIAGVTLNATDVNVTTFGPALVPEPAALSLATLATVLLLGQRRRTRG
jgi:hypothetical protein